MCYRFGFLILLLCTMSVLSVQAETAQGTVYNDVNNNAVRDAGEAGIPGVPVSNGLDVVITDENGHYTLEIEGNAEIFVIKPAGWMTPLDEDNIPTFYYVHRPEGSGSLEYQGFEPTGPLPDAIDFPLRKQEEQDTFDAVIFGDTQPRDINEINYLSRDVFSELVGIDAAFGVTLGDVAFDDLDLFVPLKQDIGTIGIPWHNVQGNHDVNRETADESQANETFISHFGPSYYAYNYGKVHFLVLDDILWEGSDYRPELGERQLTFIKNDLAHVPQDRLIVLMMHVPLPTIYDLDLLFDLIRDREHTFSMSAHTHNQSHVFMGEESGWTGAEPHHHLIHATACGSWMEGVFDERGIPHAMMSDGGPNGYSIITFNGMEYSIDFRPASRPVDYQMSIHLPYEVAVATVSDTEVLANVFAGSEKSVTRMRIDDGEWIAMDRVSRPDPDLAAWKQLEAALDPSLGRKLPRPSATPHMWAAMLPDSLTLGGHVVTVESTDMFGKTHSGHRIVRVVE